MSPRLKSIILAATPITLTIIASLILQATVLSKPEKIASILASFGPFVILGYVIFQALAIIIAPIGGFAALIAVIALFGPFIGLILSYMVSTPTFLLNFYLARRYGRPIVEKIVGRAGLKTMDHYAQDAGTFTLIILKIFQGGIFDYVSYAAGLTQIPFKTFFIVNLLGGIPGSFVSYYILTKFSSNFTQSIIILLAVAYIFAGVAIAINHIIRKHKKRFK